MIKRTTAVYHLLMVSILLLSHAVIPHVHFNSEIVIAGLDSHLTKKECDTNGHKHNDDAGTGKDTDFCLLKQVFLARSGDDDSDNSNTFFLKQIKDSQGFCSTIFHSADAFIPRPETQISYADYCPLLHSYMGYGNVNSRGSPRA